MRDVEIIGRIMVTMPLQFMASVVCVNSGIQVGSSWWWVNVLSIGFLVSYGLDLINRKEK